MLDIVTSGTCFLTSPISNFHVKTIWVSGVLACEFMASLKEKDENQHDSI